MMFFVCLFGDIQDMMIIDMSAVSTNKVKNRGQKQVFASHSQKFEKPN